MPGLWGARTQDLRYSRQALYQLSHTPSPINVLLHTGDKKLLTMGPSLLPVPRRHWTVVVKPLVRGSRWYLSGGSPLEAATSMLIRCLVSVNRVPSQYRRNYVQEERRVGRGKGVIPGQLGWNQSP